MRARTFFNVILVLLLTGILFFTAGLYFGWSEVSAGAQYFLR